MTMQTKLQWMPRPRGNGLRLLALSAGLILLSGACNLLDVTNPDVVPAANLNDPNALPTIRAGAIGDFDLAYGGSGASGSSGTNEGQILATGMLGDELINTETFPDRVQEDARQTDPASGTFATVFTNLSRARASTEGAAAKFKALSDTTTNSGYSEMTSLAGFTYVMFAEGYCSGVPITNLTASGSLIYGTPLTTVQLLDTAIARFTTALAAAGALTVNQANMQALANVGLARANLDLGNFAAAATAAGAVPTGFAYLTQYDLNTTRQNNGVFNGIRNFKRYGVADKEGGVGLPYISTVDPRTPIFRSPGTNKGFDGVTPQFDQLRYWDKKADIPLATGLEARLIQAETFLQTGDTVNFMAQLNGVRAAPPTYILAGNPAAPTTTTPAPLGAMAALSTPASPAASIALLFSERARWLWLTGHRLEDMRRLIRVGGGGYGLAANTVWPNGAYFKNGLTYGGDFNLPVPLIEQNNPNFTACLDRNP
jgi:hypothetical protein